MAARNNILWVLRIANAIKNYKKDKIGVFGVNGVGALMSCLFPSKIAFIVDEDASKQNMKFNGKDIISPAMATNDVLVAFRNPSESKRIFVVLQNRYPNINFIDLSD